MCAGGDDGGIYLLHNLPDLGCTEESDFACFPGTASGKEGTVAGETAHFFV